MEKEFVPYASSLRMIALGFDESTFGGWGHPWDNNPKPYLQLNQECEYDIVAPTYSQAFRWFREKYQLHSTITSISQESWQWHIQKPGQQLGKLYDEDFYTYEEAELACLEKLIEIVESKSE